MVRLSEDELAADTSSADSGVGSAPKSDWRVDRGAEQLVLVSSEPKPKVEDTGSESDAQR